MKKLSALLICLSGLAIAAPAAQASGGPPIPGGVYGAGGVTTPGSAFRYSTVSTGKATVVEKIRVDGGEIKRYRHLDGQWALPAVTIVGEAGGLSADGDTVVLIKPRYRLLQGIDTRLLVLDGAMSTKRLIELDGVYSFDAMSPDGESLFLVEYPDPRDPYDYRVRRYDVAAGEFRGGALVDPDEPDEKMAGQPFSRAASPDGRWAYTLYAGGDETFIHALDTQRGIAQCVDLEQLGPHVDGFRLGLGVDPVTGVVTVLDKGEPAASMDPGTLAVSDAAAAPQAGGAADGGSDGSSPPVGALAIAAGVALLAAVAVLGRRRVAGGRGRARPAPPRRPRLIAALAATLALALSGQPASNPIAADPIARIERAVAPTGPAIRRADEVIGRSGDGRPIRAIAASGIRDGPLVLVFGCIHGDECAGIGIARRAYFCRRPESGDIVVVRNLDPDGYALGTRLNRRGVDLNRNFAADWRPIGVPGDPEHSGARPFSESETRLARTLIRRLRPDVTVWFHQQADPLVRAWGPSIPAARAYARLAGERFVAMPWMDGTAPNWQNHAFPGTSSFVVELPAERSVHARHHGAALLGLGAALGDDGG